MSGTSVAPTRRAGVAPGIEWGGPFHRDRAFASAASGIDRRVAHEEISVVGVHPSHSISVGIPQRRHREKLLQDNEAVIARVRARLSGVSPDRLARRPASGGWSVAEVLEHLIVSADSYLTPMRPLIREQRGRPVDGNAVWTPTIMGGLLASSLRNPRKLPAPRSYKPGPTPRSGAPDEFLRRQEEVGRLIADAATMDWRRVKMRSPVAPILRMNLGDALTVLVVHAERHAGQIERVLSEVENQ